MHKVVSVDANRGSTINRTHHEAFEDGKPTVRKVFSYLSPKELFYYARTNKLHMVRALDQAKQHIDRLGGDSKSFDEKTTNGFELYDCLYFAKKWLRDQGFNDVNEQKEAGKSSLELAIEAQSNRIIAGIFYLGFSIDEAANRLEGCRQQRNFLMQMGKYLYENGQSDRELEIAGVFFRGP